MLDATLALATIIWRADIRSLDADFPLAVPFTMVAGGPIRPRPCVGRIQSCKGQPGKRKTAGFLPFGQNRGGGQCQREAERSMD